MKIIKERDKKNKILIILTAFLLWFCLIGVVHTYKALPSNLNYQSQNHHINSNQIEFLNDITYKNEQGEIVKEQKIFNEIISGINNAEKYILIDMFLFNSWLGKSTSTYRDLAGDMVSALALTKENKPEIVIDVITDPINTVYGGGNSENIEKLRDAGVNVTITDLKALRDSNPVYSSFWRFALQWFGNNSWPRWVKHPFSDNAQKVSLRSYLSLLNFKANHRKTFLADSGDTYVSIISSANPHSASSAHSNVALKITGTNFAKDLWISEQAVAKMSDSRLQDQLPEKSNETNSSSTIALITEKKIKDNLLSIINETQKDDELNMAMFYLSNQEIINALIKASERKAKIRIILDPNKDAFGYEKGGIPNRPVANELTEKSNGNIKIRWYDTHGEQFHSKITFANYADGRSKAVLGSANLTRRNLDNYNLETDALVFTETSSGPGLEFNEYFNKLWNNENNQHFTVDYKVYEDNSSKKTLIYRFQEFSGLSSF